MLVWAVLLPLLCVGVHSYKTYEGYKVLEVVPHTQGDVAYLATLQDQLDFWDEPRRPGDPVRFLASPEQLQSLLHTFAAKGLKPATYLEHIDRDLEELYAHIAARREAGTLNDYDYTDYNTLDAFMSEIERFAANCPAGHRCEVLTIGRSVQGIDMKVLKIQRGDGVRRPTIWVDSLIHCREWLAGTTTMAIFNRMIAANDAEALELLDSFDWYFLPVMNPDGYLYTWTGDRFWRKNRGPNSGSTCVGTDLNRNYDHRWGLAGSSSNPCSSTYRGDGLASEPETSTVQNYAYEEFPGGENLVAWVTVHTQGQYWLTCWGDCEVPPDHEEQMRVANAVCDAIEATHNTRWQCGNSCQILYATSGTTQDWAKGTAGATYGYTPELRGGRHDPPASEIQPAFEEVWNGFVAMVRTILNA